VTTALATPLGAEVTQAAPDYRICALGPLRIEGPDGPLHGEWVEQRPGELLRFLVCARRQIPPADVIAEALWPGAGPGGPNTVRHFIHALRRRLEPRRDCRTAPSAIVCRRGGYGLDPEYVWVDADEFERQAELGVAALKCGRLPAARTHLERALALYCGDFLCDEPYADWALRERERMRAIACDALRSLVRLGAESGDRGTQHLEMLAELEPFDDDVHRELIATWLSMGRWSRAARHYDSFRVRLLREFGAVPQFELQQLARGLGSQRLA
jgi:DNA-binding SARP family transcriptional activator